MNDTPDDDVQQRNRRLTNIFSEITEIDINPTRVFHQGEGCMALDARGILSGGDGPVS